MLISDLSVLCSVWGTVHGYGQVLILHGHWQSPRHFVYWTKVQPLDFFCAHMVVSGFDGVRRGVAPGPLEATKRTR
jgi:hypothetical protein